MFAPAQPTQPPPAKPTAGACQKRRLSFVHLYELGEVPAIHGFGRWGKAGWKGGWEA